MQEKARRTQNCDLQFPLKILGLPLFLRVLCVSVVSASLFAMTGFAQATQQSPQQPPIATPTPDQTDPVAALAAALTASCRHDVTEFTSYLTPSNAGAFRALTPPQQIALLRRMVQLEDSGQPLLSTDANGRTVLRCDTPSIVAEIRFGATRIDENFAFINIELNKLRSVDFGMLRTSSGWKLFSVGLLVLDVPQLTAQWEQQEMEAREQNAVDALRTIAQALDTYQQAFQKLPESLQELGAAGKEGISPEHAGLLEAPLANSQVPGYAIRYRIVPSSNEEKPPVFELAATPQQYGKTGVRSFFLDSTGKLRGADKQGAPATIVDPIIDSSQPGSLQ